LLTFTASGKSKKSIIIVPPINHLKVLYDHFILKIIIVIPSLISNKHRNENLSRPQNKIIPLYFLKLANSSKKPTFVSHSLIFLHPATFEIAVSETVI